MSGPTDLIQPPVLPQLVGHGEVVDFAVLRLQGEHRRIHGAVLITEEVLWLQADIDDDGAQVPLVEEHRPEHRLLGLEVVRRDQPTSSGHETNRDANRLRDRQSGRPLAPWRLIVRQSEVLTQRIAHSAT